MKIIKTILLAGIIGAGFNNNYAVNFLQNINDMVVKQVKKHPYIYGSVALAITAYGFYKMFNTQQKDIDEQLLDACKLQQPNIDAIRKLLQAGAQINIKDEHGETPLHIAAWKGHAQMAKILINAGAQINIKDNHGRTPLCWAAYYYHASSVAKILIDAGAQPITVEGQRYASKKQ